MNNKTIIRILAGLSFLIFFCPFFQMCSDTTLRENHTEANTGKGNSTAEETRVFEARRQENTANFYKINSIFFDRARAFKIEDYEDIGFYFSMCFAVSLVFSIIILALSFLNKFKLIITFSVGNLISSILMTSLFYYGSGLEDFSQIKFGYYLFILNTVALIVFSRKQTIAKSIS